MSKFVMDFTLTRGYILDPSLKDVTALLAAQYPFCQILPPSDFTCALKKAKQMMLPLDADAFRALPAEQAWNLYEQTLRAIATSQPARIASSSLTLLDAACLLSEKTQPATTAYFHPTEHLGNEAVLFPSLSFYLQNCSLKCTYCTTPEYVFQEKHESLLPLTRSMFTSTLEKINKEWTVNLHNALEMAQRNNVAEGKTLDALHGMLKKPVCWEWVGGEPSLKTVAILSCLKEVPEHFLPPVMAVTTNGYGNPRLFSLLASFCDMALVGFRHGNDTCAFQLTGARNYTQTVLQNIQLLVSLKVKVIVRVVSFPEHIDCCLKPLTSILQPVKENIFVSVLPYVAGEMQYSDGDIPEAFKRIPMANTPSLRRASTLKDVARVEALFMDASYRLIQESADFYQD